MPFDPAIFGRRPHQTATFGNAIFGRIGVASGAAVIPIEALGYGIIAGPDVTLTLQLPRGPGVSGLMELIGGSATPAVTAPILPTFHALPTRRNFRFTEGTTYRVQFNFIDLLNNPVNLSGASLLMNVYQRNAPRQAASPLLVKSIGAGILVLDLLNGVAMVTFSYTDTHDLPGAFDWEIQITELNGDIYTPGMGIVIVSPARRTLQ